VRIVSTVRVVVFCYDIVFLCTSGSERHCVSPFVQTLVLAVAQSSVVIVRLFVFCEVVSCFMSEFRIASYSGYITCMNYNVNIENVINLLTLSVICCNMRKQVTSQLE